MLIVLPVLWIVILDILAWLVIHLGVAYLMTQLPESMFKPEAWLFVRRTWEGDGTIYQTFFRVKQWKNYLPDGAALFRRGFKKKRLSTTEPEYVERFIKETCRGELAHWIVWCCAPIFVIWNYWWVGVIMILYATVANFPCILTQRYNRIRFSRLIKHTNQKEVKNT